LEAAQIVTATYPLEQASEAFEAAARGEHVKVLVRP
jgi:Zn-dependent alcohol dehydrogenase